MTDIWWPLDKVQVTGPWGVGRTGLAGHNGIDLGHNPIGTPVYAADDGVIEFEGWGQNHSWMGAIAGISVLIKHTWGYTGYAHLNSTIVNRGQRVTRGQQIGTLGSTGGSTGPHVHFETLPLSPAFGNGYAGRVNPQAIATIRARGWTPGPAPTPGGGDTVIHYHREDTKARASGRIIKPGEYIYLDTRPNPNPSNATTVVGGVGNYSITPHVYASGEPGDEIDVKLIWQKGEGAQSQHYTESVVIGPQGNAFRSTEFKRRVDAGWSVWVCVSARKSNKRDVKITLLDCDAHLFA